MIFRYSLPWLMIFMGMLNFLATATAPQPPFPQRQNGETKFMASTSMPCSRISLVASVLSNPPDNNASAFIFFVSSYLVIFFYTRIQVLFINLFDNWLIFKV